MARLDAVYFICTQQFSSAISPILSSSICDSRTRSIVVLPAPIWCLQWTPLRAMPLHAIEWKVFFVHIQTRCRTGGGIIIIMKWKSNKKKKQQFRMVCACSALPPFNLLWLRQSTSLYTFFIQLKNLFRFPYQSFHKCSRFHRALTNILSSNSYEGAAVSIPNDIDIANQQFLESINSKHEMNVDIQAPYIAYVRCRVEIKVCNRIGRFLNWDKRASNSNFSHRRLENLGYSLFLPYVIHKFGNAAKVSRADDKAIFRCQNPSFMSV